jgi:vacuolar-type H+-ATPase subunit H
LAVTDLEKAEILRQIKEAEEKVRISTKEAEERRKQLQAEGKRIAIEKFDASEAALRKEMDQRLSDARSRIESQKKGLLDEGARKAEALKSNAQKRMNKAEAFILDEFERTVDA